MIIIASLCSRPRDSRFNSRVQHLLYFLKEYRRQKREKLLQRIKTEMQNVAQKTENSSLSSSVDLHDLLASMAGESSPLYETS